MNILISGVSSGLGKNLAIGFLSGGHNVWGISRKPIDSPKIRDLVVNKNFVYTQCDVSIEEDVASLVDHINKKSFPLNIVILNAGIMQNDMINKKFDYAKFKEIFAVNFFGAIAFIDKILPFFQQKGEGVFIGISSLASHRATVINKIAYSTAKAALNMAFESFRLQLGEPKIRFIIVNLGRLTEKKSTLWVLSYKRAAEKVISLVNKKRNVFNYPLLPFLRAKVLQVFPDSFISKYIIEKVRLKAKNCE